jgi:hypothetical protein
VLGPDHGPPSEVVPPSVVDQVGSPDPVVPPVVQRYSRPLGVAGIVKSPTLTAVERRLFDCARILSSATGTAGRQVKLVGRSAWSSSLLPDRS